MYDIAIIGLGPAGATLARLLSRDFKIIAIDKKRCGGTPGMPRDAQPGFQKPCGGLLAVDAQKALSRFNLTLPKDILVDPQIFAVKTIDTKQHLRRHYQRFYINMDRHKFDQWLISLIPAQVQLEQATCTGIEKTTDGYAVTYIKDGRRERIHARFVVGADGSKSPVRKALFPHQPIRRYISLQQWFKEDNSSPFYSCIFDSEITDSYCWTISKDGYFVLGGAFPLTEGKSRFQLLKTKLKQHGFIFGQAIKTEACLISMPRGPHDFCLGADGAFLLGEAAGFISPSSLEGISYALNSAYDLAAILNSRRPNPNLHYRLKTLPMRLKLLAKCLKRPFMYWSFPRKCIMKSGLMAIRVVEEDNK